MRLLSIKGGWPQTTHHPHTLRTEGTCLSGLSVTCYWQASGCHTLREKLCQLTPLQGPCYNTRCLFQLFVNDPNYNFYLQQRNCEAMENTRALELEQMELFLFLSLVLWLDKLLNLSVPQFTCLLIRLKIPAWASLVAQWLRMCLPMKGTGVWALVWEDPTCHGATRPMSHNYWACASGARAPQQERPR